MRRIFVWLTMVSTVAGAVAVALPARAADCGVTSTGRTPLPDLGEGLYEGEVGGLYPDGSNTPPAEHQTAALAVAQTIVPRGPDGVTAADGSVVLLSIGMSNTTMEFQQFMQIIATRDDVHPRLVLVDGAQGGQDVVEWNTPGSQTWENVEARLQMAGVTREQVQVVWFKHQIGGDMTGEFPDGTRAVKDEMRGVLQHAKDLYPNLQLAYTASRTYAGYSPDRERGAYEQGFAVKWLIEDQIAGDPLLAWMGSGAEAPLLLWGPYLWADGLGPDGVLGGEPGRSDGLEYECGDFKDDGVHPSEASGQQKVAELLVEFFEGESSACAWFWDGGCPEAGSEESDGGAATTEAGGDSGSEPTGGEGAAETSGAAGVDSSSEAESAGTSGADAGATDDPAADSGCACTAGGHRFAAVVPLVVAIAMRRRRDGRR